MNPLHVKSSRDIPEFGLFQHLQLEFRRNCFYTSQSNFAYSLHYKQSTQRLILATPEKLKLLRNEHLFTLWWQVHRVFHVSKIWWSRFQHHTTPITPSPFWATLHGACKRWPACAPGSQSSSSELSLLPFFLFRFL